MKRKIVVPPKVAEAVKWHPKAQVVRNLSRFPTALTVIPVLVPVGKGWLEVTLEDAGSLSRMTDHQIRNLMMLTYLDNPPEFCYRNLVAGLYPDSQVEVITTAGIVDVMTQNWVIEVKEASSWKHALGQALAYSVVTGREPAVALFGTISLIAKDILKTQGVEVIVL